MEKTRKSRGTLRTSFTKTYGEINTLLEDDEKDIREIRALFELLGNRYDKILELDSQIFTKLLDDDASQQDMDNEQETTDKYSLNFSRVKAAVLELEDDHCSVAAASVAPSYVSNNPKRTFKLQILELKKFSGDIKEWLQFWTQFRKIDEDDSIEAGDKFQYLIQATVSGTKARELVESFPAIEGNYPKVIAALKSRYGREDLLIEVYVRELLTLVLQNTLSTNSMSLVSLYDKLECHLRALETLNVTTEKCASMLLPLVESCLPEEVLRLWKRNNAVMSVVQSTESLDKTETAKDRLDQLMRFIAVEVANEQKIILAKTGFGVTSNKINKKKERGFKSINSTTEELPTAASLLTTTTKKQTYGCVFCNGNHKSAECFKAQKMSLNEKCKMLESKNGCFRPGHQARMCKSRTKCVIWGRRHNVLMCDKLPNISDTNLKSSEPKKEENKVQVQDNTLANISNTPDVLLQTLLVKIKGNGVTCHARAVIDSGSQRSYIRKETAERMKLEPKRKENIQHSLFGGTTTNVCDHDVFIVYLSNLEDTYKCNFEVLDQDVICGRLPPVKQGSWIQELERDNIKLTDMQERPVEILIGADVAGKLITGEHRILSSGLVATETKLGWTLMGKMPGHQNKENTALVVTSMLVKESNLSDLWALDVLGISDPIEKRTKEELHLAAVHHFQKTVKVNEEDR